MFLKCALLLALSAGAYALPVDLGGTITTECASSCPLDSKFGWEESKTYTYSYTGDMKSHIQGATEEQSSLHIQTNVQIEVLSRCEMVLGLSNVVLQDSEPGDYNSRQPVPESAAFKDALEQNPVRFAFKDGEIEGVCPEGAELPWVLNVKKAILSNLQNTMSDLGRTTRVDELDISGNCPVLYTPLGSGKIQKSKEIMGCTGSHSYESVFQGVPYDSASKIQSLPLLKSSHVCEQTLNSANMISEVVCTERHMFRPFSKEESGAVTEVMTKLELLSVQDGVQTRIRPIERHEQLYYDATPTVEEMDVRVRDAQTTISEICGAMQDDVRPEVSGLYTTLVKQMRQLDLRGLNTVYRNSKRACTKAGTFFRDAIPMLQTTASVSLVKDLIGSSDTSAFDADVWLTAIAFIPKPSLELLSEASSLLSISGLAARKAALAVSSLVNTYCRTDGDCMAKSEIQAIMTGIEGKLNYNCNGDHETVLMALKAVGNAGHNDRISDTLGRCFSNDQIPMELRVAAITAYRRLPCSVDRTALLNMYNDLAMDSELRINAFIQLMKCPTVDLIDTIRDSLAMEQINQVGSFVWTFLTNLQETSDPLKQGIADILGDEEFQKTFDLDARKFSRNVEWSGFSHLLNTGATLESNIIMSHQSFVPRTANLNVTVDMFGQAFNLFEVEGRLEGFEKLLEDLFGPKQEFNDLVGRNKRSLANNLDAFDSTYQPRPDTEPHAAYSVKIFGNEIRYGDFHSVSVDGLKDKLNFIDWLIGLAQEHDMEVTKSLLFLEASMIVPTATGLPLKLDAEGAATVNLKASGKLDILRIMSDPAHIDIDGSITPSGAVEVRSTMGVDAVFAKTGLEMVSTLHSSTIMQGKIQLRDGSVFSMDLDMPTEKQEIINVQSKFLITHRDEKREQVMLTDNVWTVDECAEMRVLGLELCAKASVPLSTSASAPMLPLTGPTSASLVLNKKDTHTGYHLEAKFEQDKSPAGINSDLVMFSVNTPGSGVDREITTRLFVDRVNKAVEWSLRSPWKTINFEGSVIHSPSQWKLMAETTVDTAKYSFTADMPITNPKNGVEYSPAVTVEIPGMQPMKATGRLFINPGRKVEYELKLKNIFSQLAKVDGSVLMIDNQRKMRYDVSCDIESQFFTTSVSGNIDHTKGQSLSSRIELKYAIGGGREESFVLNNKLKDQSTNTLTQYDLNSQWTSTVWPDYDGDLNLDYSFGRNSLSVNFDTGFDKNSRVKVTQSGNYDFTSDEKIVDGFVKLELPRGSEYELTVKHSHSTDDLSSVLSLKYAPSKEGTLEVNLKRETRSPLKLSGDMKLTYPGQEITLTESIEQKNKNEFHHSFEMAVQTDTVIDMKSVLKIRPRLELTTDLTIPKLQPIKLLFFVNPNIKDLEGHAEFNYGTNQYYIDGEWNHGGNVNAFASRGKMDLKFPGRRIKAAADLSRRSAVISGNFATQWDADNDQSKEFKVTGKTTLSVENPEFYIKGEMYPGKFIEFDANAKYETASWMRSSSDLEGTLALKSSYPSFEDIGFSFKYDHSPSAVVIHTEGGAGQNKIIGDLSMNTANDYMESGMTLKVTTPFTTWHDIDLNANYAIRGRNLESAVKFEWDGKPIELTLNGQGNIRRHAVSGTMIFSSYLTDPVTVEASHNDNGQVFNSKMTATWGQNQQMVYEQTLTYQALRKLEADIKFTSPFENFEEITLVSTTERNGNTYTADHELKWADDQMIKLTSSLTYLGLIFDGNLRLTTPMTAFDRLIINIENTKQGALYIGHADLECTGLEKVELDTTIGIGSKKKMAFTFKSEPTLGVTEFNAEFDGYAREFSTVLEFQNTKLQTEKISLTTKLDISNLRDASANIKYTSPFEPVTFVTVLLSHKKQGRTYTTEGSLEYPQYKGTIKNTATITSWLNFNANTEVEYVEGQKIEQMVSLSTDPNIEAKYDFKSPFNNPISFSLTHQGEAVNFNTEVSLTYKRGRKIIGKAEFSMDSSPIKGEFSLNTPFKGWRKMELKFDHTKNRRAVRSNIEMSWNPRNKITGNLEITMVRQKHTGSLTITTPFSKFSRFLASYSFEGPIRDFTTETALEINNSRYTSDATFKWDSSAKSVELTNTLTTPHEGYENINVKFTYSGPPKDFTASAELTIGDQTGTVTVTSNVLDNIKVDFAISNPFDLQWFTLTSLKGGINHKARNWRNFDADGYVEINGQRFASDVEFRWFGTTFRLNTNVRNPSEDYGLLIKHKGRLSDFSTTVTLDTGSDDVKAEAGFKNEQNLKTGNFELVTPFDGYERTALDFNHAGQIDDFTTTLKIETPNSNLPTLDITISHKGVLTAFDSSLKAEWDGKTLESSLSFSFEQQKTEGSLSLTTPFQGYENFVLSVNYDVQPNSFTVGANLETPFENAERTSVEVKYEAGASQGMSASAELITSVQGWENWKAEFEYKPINNGFTVTATVTTPIQDYSLFKASLNQQGFDVTSLQTTLTIETSVPAFNRFMVELHHQFANGNLATSFTVETPFDKFASQSVGVSFQGVLNDFTARATLGTSYPGYETWGIKITHVLNDQGMTSEAQVTTPLPAYESLSAEVGYTINGNGFKASAIAESSVRGFERFSAELEYSMTDIGLTTKIEILTPIQRWNKFTADFVYASRNDASFKTKLSIDTPVRAFNHFSIDISHEGGANDFETSVELALPLRKFPEFGVSVSHKGYLKDFTTGIAVTYGTNKKIDTRIQFKTDGNLYEGSIKLTSPFPVVQEFDLYATHDRSGSGNLDITINGNKVVDLDYTYSKTVPFSLEININHPRPYSIVVNFDMKGITYKGDVAINFEGQRFSLDMNVNNKVESYSLERSFEISVSLPSGKYRRFKTEYSATPSSISETTEIQWARNDQKKASLNLELTKSSTRHEQTVAGNLQITSPWLNSQSNINHVVRAGQEFITEVEMRTDKTITLKNELTLNRPGFKNSFTMNHPSLRDPVKFELEADIGGTKVEGNLNIQFAGETMTMHGKVARERANHLIEIQMTHPNSYLDMDFMGEWEDSADVIGLTSHFKWKTSSDRQIQEYKLVDQYRKNDKEILFQLSCPSQTIELSGKKSMSDSRRGVHRWSLVGSCDQKQMKAEFGWSRPDKTRDAIIQLGDDKLQIVHIMNNVRDGSLEMSHEIGGQKTQDMFFSVSTDGNGVFNGRSYIRPDIMKDLTDYVKGIHLVDGGNCLKDFMTTMGEDIQQKWTLMRQRTLPAVNAAIDDIAGDQIDVIKRTYTRMYKNNDFQMRKIVNTIFRNYGTFKTVVGGLAEKSNDGYTRLQHKVTAKLTFWGNKLNREANELGQRIVELRDEYGPVMQDFREIVSMVTNKVKGLVTSVRNHPIVRRAKATLQRLESMDLLEPVRNLQTKIEQKVEQLRQKYSQYFQVFDDVWGNVGRRQEFRRVKGLLGKARKSVIWFMNTYKVKERIQQAAQDINQISLDAIQSQIMDEVRNRFKFDKNNIKSWDPESGNYEVQFYVPEDPFRDMDLPKLYLKENLMKLMSWWSENIEDLEVTAYDVLYSYQPSDDWSEWLPPFGAHAFLSGSQHFITFDKTFFEYAADCTFLLARDFVDYHFSIAVQYENNAQRKTILVSADGEDLEIRDGQVYSGGSTLELPWKSDHLDVRRLNSDIRIDCTHGVTVTCSIYYDLCTVNFTGWYFGKMGGLLGTYDNEPYTDFTSSTNERLPSIEEVANTWAIGRQCYASNIARKVVPQPGDEAYELCAKYFKDARSSPFRACFTQVKPDIYMQMCLNDMGRDGINKEEDICMAGASYVKECNLHKYPIRIAHTCVKCKDQNGAEFPEGEELRLEGQDVPQSADVVLVIEQALCNEEVVPSLAEAVEDLNEALESQGLTGNKFGIVGYGAEGKFSEPHVQTLGGEIMNDVQHIASGLNNLDLDASATGDALMALQYAMKYPFRTGVSKTVILMPCHACFEGQTRYHEIQQLFRDRDVNLHVVLDHDFKLKGKKKPLPQVFGADKEGLFTRKHVKGSLESDKELYNQVKLPKDICVEIAFEQGGTAFNIRHLLDSRRAFQKRFVEAMVRVIANIAEPSDCQICECMPGEDGVGRSECRVCIQEQNFYNLYPSLFGGPAVDANAAKTTFDLEFDEYMNDKNRP